MVSGVFPDPDGRHIWMLSRCGANHCALSDQDAILKFDLDGNVVKSFGAGMFSFPHGFFLDHEGYLWVTEGAPAGDAREVEGLRRGLGHQVFKLNQDGEGSSPELCVKVRGSSSMLLLGCLGDLLRFEKREIQVATLAPDRSSP